MKKFLSSLLLCLTPLFIPADAAAQTTYNVGYTAAACQAMSGSTISINGYGQIGNPGSGSIFLMCPVPTDSGHSINSVTFYYWTNGSISALQFQPAIENASGGGYSTVGGLSVVSSGSGNSSAVLSSSTITTGFAGKMAFVQIILGPVSSGSANTLFGYIVNHN